jgi:hypothetical protein
VKISEAATAWARRWPTSGSRCSARRTRPRTCAPAPARWRSSRPPGAFDDNLALGAGGDDIDRQLHELTSQSAVDDDLARMKAELGQGSAPGPRRSEPGKEGAGVIVRISTEGQYRFPDEEADRLNDLDNGSSRRSRAADEDAFHERFEELLALIRSEGSLLDGEELEGSGRDPAAARHLVRRGVGGVHGEGLIPD